MRNKASVYVFVKLLSVYLVLLAVQFSYGYSGGSGTDVDPYQIANKADLLAMAANTNDYLGLFARIGESAIVRNLEASDIFIIVNGVEASYAGSLCGENNGGTIERCFVTGLILGGSGTSFEYVGGLCGLNSGLVSNCYVSVNIFAGLESSCMGGVCGYNTGIISGSYAEGDAFGYDMIGGISGCNDGGTISECGSRMDITAYGLAGGVCGYNQSGFISRSFSNGSVTGMEMAGGVCGGNAYGTIENSYFGGVVTSGADSTQIGGVCGLNLLGFVEKCYLSGSERSRFPCFADGELCGMACFGERTCRIRRDTGHSCQ